MAEVSVAADMLQSFVRRIESLDDEILAMNADKSEVYKEAKGNGFDVKVLRKLIADRRKDASERAEFETIYELYAEALDMRLYRDEGTKPTLVRAHVEPIEQFPVEHDEDGVFPETPEPDDQFWQGGEHIHEQQPALAARDLTVPQALTGQVANHTPEMATSGEAVVSAAAAVGASPTIREAEDIGSQPAGGENVAGHPSEDTVEKSGFVDDLTRAGATTSSDVEPVAPSNITQLRAPKPLRPNCLKPTMCGASGPVHCWSCVKALGEHQKAAQ